MKDNALELWRLLERGAREFRRIVLEDRRCCFRGGALVKGVATREHFMQHASERKDVAAVIRGFGA